MLSDLLHVIWILYALLSPKYTDNPILPGDAMWLGDYGDGADIPNLQRYLPISYVIIGDQGVAIPRIIISTKEKLCPKLIYHGNNDNNHFTIPNVTLRAKGDTILPYAFPIQICETILKTKKEKYLWNNNILKFDINISKNNIKIPFNPSSYLLIGDTGLRSKPTNLGLGTCEDGPSLYGVNQCSFNFTKNDINKEEINGDFQYLNKWYYPTMMKKIVAKEQNNNHHPHVVIHVGDYLYRQGPCGVTTITDQGSDDDDTSSSSSCMNINGPPTFSIDDLNGTIFNFLPGTWGDNLYGWWADFLYPTLDLLSTIPFIALRGNHEECDRGGHGYYLFLYPGPYNSSNRAGDMCEEYQEPYVIPFKHEQFLIMDDSAVMPLDKGVDHFDFIKGACPSRPPPNSNVIIPIEQNRYNDPTQNPYDIQNQIDIYTNYFQKLEDASQSYDTNFYLGHRPLFAIACNNTDMITGDWTMQQALGRNTLDRVSAAICGHMHWLEVLTFENKSFPPQIVVGNGGTKLIPNYVNQSVLPYIKLKVGKHGNLHGKVMSGVTNSSFGYGIMNRNTENGDYTVQFYNLNVDSLQMDDIFTLDIPKGPRISTSSSSNSRRSSTYSFYRNSYFGISICIVSISLIMISFFHLF